LPEISQAISRATPFASGLLAPVALIPDQVVEESSEGSPPGVLVLEETTVAFSTEVLLVLFALTVFSPLLDSDVLDTMGDWQSLDWPPNSA